MFEVLTAGFECSTSGSELCSYSGLTPIIRKSGSSASGRSKIIKMGNRKLRNLLFMCGFKACREIYERIVAKERAKN